MSEYIWRCDECDWQGTILAYAKHPFRPDEEVCGCPQCGNIEDLRNICDEPGCKREATCGCPSEAGYRRTCFNHSDFVRKAAQ